jgi:hypothetical protein
MINYFITLEWRTKPKSKSKEKLCVCVLGFFADMIKDNGNGIHRKERWERAGVKNFPCFCKSWKSFELELEGRQFLFRCLLVPDTQPYVVDYESGNIVPTPNPRSKKIHGSEMNIRRYKCEHSGWPNSDCHHSDQVGCSFFLVAIKPYEAEDDVFVQIGSNQGDGITSRNLESFHNHLPKALWLRKSPNSPEKEHPGLIVHPDFLSSKLKEKLIQKVQDLLVKSESRLTHLTDEILQEVQAIVIKRVNKWEKLINSADEPFEWVVEVCLPRFYGFINELTI